MLKFCSSEKKIGKTFENCSFRTSPAYGPCPKSSSIFSGKTKGDHKLLRTFDFIKIS